MKEVLGGGRGWSDVQKSLAIMLTGSGWSQKEVLKLSCFPSSQRNASLVMSGKTKSEE